MCYDFFLNFQQSDILKIQRLEILNLVVRYYDGNLRNSKLEILRLNANAQMLLVSEIDVFYDLFRIFQKT